MPSRRRKATTPRQQPAMTTSSGPCSMTSASTSHAGVRVTRKVSGQDRTSSIGEAAAAAAAVHERQQRQQQGKQRKRRKTKRTEVKEESPRNRRRGKKQALEPQQFTVRRRFAAGNMDVLAIKRLARKGGVVNMCPLLKDASDVPVVWALGELKAECKVAVWWSVEKEWFPGSVQHNGDKKGTKIWYEDGETHIHDMEDEQWRLYPPPSRVPVLGDVVRVWWRCDGTYRVGRVVRVASRGAPGHLFIRYLPSEADAPPTERRAGAQMVTNGHREPLHEVQHNFYHETFKILGPRDKVFRDIRNDARMRVAESTAKGGKGGKGGRGKARGKGANKGKTKVNGKAKNARSSSPPDPVDVKKQRRGSRGGHEDAAGLRTRISSGTGARRRSTLHRPTEQMRSLLDEVFSRVLLCSKHTLRCLAVPVSKAQFPDYFDKVRNPIDLRTMRQRVRCAKEQDVSREALVALLTQMVENSAIYNGTTHFVTVAAKELRRTAQDYMYTGQQSTAFADAQRAIDESKEMDSRRLLHDLVRTLNQEGAEGADLGKRLNKRFQRGISRATSSNSLSISSGSSASPSPTNRKVRRAKQGSQCTDANPPDNGEHGVVRVGVNGGKQMIMPTSATTTNATVKSESAPRPHAAVPAKSKASTSVKGPAGYSGTGIATEPRTTRRGRVAQPARRFDPSEEAARPQWGIAASGNSNGTDTAAGKRKKKKHPSTSRRRAPSDSGSDSDSNSDSTSSGTDSDPSDDQKRKKTKKPRVSTKARKRAKKGDGRKTARNGESKQADVPPKARPRLTFRMKLHPISPVTKTKTNAKATILAATSADKDTKPTPANMDPAALLAQMEQRDLAMRSANTFLNGRQHNDAVGEGADTDDDAGSGFSSGDDDDPISRHLDDDDPILRHLDTADADEANVLQKDSAPKRGRSVSFDAEDDTDTGNGSSNNSNDSDKHKTSAEASNNSNDQEVGHAHDRTGAGSVVSSQSSADDDGGILGRFDLASLRRIRSFESVTSNFSDALSPMSRLADMHSSPVCTTPPSSRASSNCTPVKMELGTTALGRVPSLSDMRGGSRNQALEMDDMVVSPAGKAVMMSNSPSRGRSLQMGSSASIIDEDVNTPTLNPSTRKSTASGADATASSNGARLASETPQAGPGTGPDEPTQTLSDMHDPPFLDLDDGLESGGLDFLDAIGHSAQPGNPESADHDDDGTANDPDKPNKPTKADSQPKAAPNIEAEDMSDATGTNGGVDGASSACASAGDSCGNSRSDETDDSVGPDGDGEGASARCTSSPTAPEPDSTLDRENIERRLSKERLEAWVKTVENLQTDPQALDSTTKASRLGGASLLDHTVLHGDAGSSACSVESLDFNRSAHPQQGMPEEVDQAASEKAAGAEAEAGVSAHLTVGAPSTIAAAGDRSPAAGTRGEDGGRGREAPLATRTNLPSPAAAGARTFVDGGEEESKSQIQNTRSVTPLSADSATGRATSAGRVSLDDLVNDKGFQRQLHTGTPLSGLGLSGLSDLSDRDEVVA